MIIASLAALVCGIIYSYANISVRHRIHEYQGWLIYIHVLKYGVFAFIACFSFFQIFIPTAFYLAYKAYMSCSFLSESNYYPPLSFSYFVSKSPVAYVSKWLEIFTNGELKEHDNFIISLSFISIVSTYLLSKAYEWLPSLEEHRQDKLDESLLEQYSKHSLINLTLLEAFHMEEYILITLDSGKAYVGLLSRIPASISEKELVEFDIAIYIYESGYREKNSHEYIKTNDYNAILTELHSDDDAPIILIPRTSITSISKFNTEIYKNLKDQRSKEKSVRTKLVRLLTKIINPPPPSE